MYVSSGVRLLPLRWREKTVNFVSPRVEREASKSRNNTMGKTPGGRLGFCSAVEWNKEASAAASSVTKNQIVGAGGGSPQPANWAEDAWCVYKGSRGNGTDSVRAVDSRRASVDDSNGASSILFGVTRLQEQHDIMEEEVMESRNMLCERGEVVDARHGNRLPWSG